MRRVLIVDDDHLVAETLSLIFSKSGYESRAAYSAEDALELAREQAPDLLLCDVSMPDRGGLDLVNDFAQEFPECRVIMLTAFYANLTSVREQASKLARPMGILTKPCQPSDLLREATAMLAAV